MPARGCQEIVLRLMVANRVRSQIALAGKCPLPSIKGSEQHTIPPSGLSCNDLTGTPGLGGGLDWLAPHRGEITMYDFTFHNVHVHKQKKREAEPHQCSYSGGETGVLFMFCLLFCISQILCHEYVLLL